MAKKSEKLTAFEEEMVAYYMEDYIRTVELNSDSSLDQLEKLVTRFRYGGDFRSQRMMLDWGKVFDKHVCPVCADLITLSEKQYVCNKCKLSIPLDLYDKAAAHYEKEAELARKGQEFSKKVTAKKISETRISELYDIALDRASSGLDEKKEER